jgi:hypothetical protein
VGRRDADTRLARLRAWLGRVGLAVPGSLVRSRQRPNLWLWHHQIWLPREKRWRTVTRVVPEPIVPVLRAAIATDRRFRAAHRVLRALSMRVIEARRQEHLRRRRRGRHEPHR